MIVSKDFYTPPLPCPAALRGVIKRYKSILSRNHTTKIPPDIRSYRAAFYIQIDRILFQSVGKSSISFMNGSSTFGKCLFLGSVQFQLNHFFNTVFTQYKVRLCRGLSPRTRLPAKRCKEPYVSGRPIRPLPPKRQQHPEHTMPTFPAIRSM